MTLGGERSHTSGVCGKSKVPKAPDNVVAAERPPFVVCLTSKLLEYGRHRNTETGQQFRKFEGVRLGKPPPLLARVDNDGREVRVDDANSVSSGVEIVCYFSFQDAGAVGNRDLDGDVGGPAGNRIASEVPKTILSNNAYIGNNPGSARQSEGRFDEAKVAEILDTCSIEELADPVLDEVVRESIHFAFADLSVDEFEAIVVAVLANELVKGHRRRDWLGSHDSSTIKHSVFGRRLRNPIYDDRLHGHFTRFQPEAELGDSVEDGDIRLIGIPVEVSRTTSYFPVSPVIRSITEAPSSAVSRSQSSGMVMEAWERRNEPLCGFSMIFFKLS